MKKLARIFICVISFPLIISTVSYADCDCGTVEKVMALTLESVNNNAYEVVDTLMKKPDMSSVTDCLTNVRGGLAGFFSLSLPSIDSLLSGICEAIMDYVYEAATSYISDAMGDISTWGDFFDIQWKGQFGLDETNGNSMWSIDGDIVDFHVDTHDVDISDNIDDLFN